MLALDVGNTLVKWRIQAKPESNFQEGSFNAAEISSQLPLLLESHKIHEAYISWVGASTAKSHVIALLSERRIGCHLLESQNEALGLVNGYDDYKRLGVDRWLAMLGIWVKQRSAFCVVDAGTALTIDFVDEKGRHTGGYIMPGLKTILSSLDNATALIGDTKSARVQSGRHNLTPGRCTEDAVLRGALLSLVGGIECALSESIKSTSSRRPTLCFIGGGDSRVIGEMLEGTWCRNEQLVLDGIFAYARSLK